MAERSKKIRLLDYEKLSQVNKENLEYLERFKIDMSLRELSEGTKRSYVYNLQQWFIYILDHQNNRSVLSMTDDDITAFLFFCKSGGNNSSRMKHRISVISSFYKFLRKKKLLTTNPTEFIESPKKIQTVEVKTYLTSEQVAQMREKLIEMGDTQLRLYAMLSLSTMARVSAIASLRWSQIDIQNCVIHDVPEKEGKIVDLYFNDEVKYLLMTLKGERELKNRNDFGYVFFGGRNRTKPLSKSTLTNWCHKIGTLIDVPTLHPHDFRHSGATLLKNAGMTLEDISVLLNHESTDTTRRFYIKEDKRRINDMKNRINF